MPTLQNILLQFTPPAINFSEVTQRFDVRFTSTEIENPGMPGFIPPNFPFPFPPPFRITDKYSATITLFQFRTEFPPVLGQNPTTPVAVAAKTIGVNKPTGGLITMASVDFSYPVNNLPSNFIDHLFAMVTLLRTVELNNTPMFTLPVNTGTSNSLVLPFGHHVGQFPQPQHLSISNLL